VLSRIDGWRLEVKGHLYSSGSLKNGANLYEDYLFERKPGIQFSLCHADLSSISLSDHSTQPLDVVWMLGGIHNEDLALVEVRRQYF